LTIGVGAMGHELEDLNTQMMIESRDAMVYEGLKGWLSSPKFELRTKETSLAIEALCWNHQKRFIKF
jgi:hypothetical protein